MGYIYKITNEINGKIYVGQTIKPVESVFPNIVIIMTSRIFHN